MIQIIEEATRNENTLDLVYTNDKRIVTNIDVNTSAISDHNEIEITTVMQLRLYLMKLKRRENLLHFISECNKDLK